jgi:hypothetical protein
MRIVAFLLACLIASCSSPKREPAQETTAPVESNRLPLPQLDIVVPDVTCSVDPSQSYALFLPSGYVDTVRMQVMVFLDPQGSGSTPLSKYESLARENGVILIGSNSCKNGMTFEQTTQVITNLVREAELRWNASGVALAGFSGGAKAALYAAQDIQGLLTVIFCGAALPFESLRPLPPLLGFSGTRDMNYYETANSMHGLGETPAHVFVDWDGKHEWPSPATFQEAFDWCAFTAMRAGSVPRDDSRIDRYRKSMEHSIRSTSSDFRKASLANRAAVFLNGLTDVSGFRLIQQEASRTDSFRKEMQARQASYSLENDLKNQYLVNLEGKDEAWWRLELRRLKSPAGDKTGRSERLMGYISLVAYTYARDAVSTNRFAPAWKYLTVYKIADPENPEQPFLMACFFARQGDADKALLSLKEAFRLGFKDKARMESEPAFQSLRNTGAYKSLVGAS